MSEIPKAYDPALVEDKWYAAWQSAGCFTAVRDESKAPFAIMIPPPNVTGVLHMGHLLNNTIQDILIRRARQEGKAALWLPGTDHAGIATQTRVEKELRQKEKKTRHDLGREKFVERAAEWRDKHGDIILNQLKKLGASCDWSRKVHTLDAGYSKAVLQAFVTMYERGHIYRGKRMVNWCPVSMTGLSDEEVIMKPSKGSFYRMRYEIVERPGEYIEISTTRPETIPGDAAVAVHPTDERYAHLHGLHVWRPICRIQIPIITDEAVEKDFGSGALKVTPAHDRTDFEIGLRHKLPQIDVMRPDGVMNDLAGPLAGVERFKARKLAAELLKESGNLLEEKPYENNVGYSERADVPIESRLSEQWFVKYPKIPEALRAVESGTVTFHPERWNKVYAHWLNNIQDWCISRQLWWGHRIPVWYRKDADRNDPANRHVGLEGPADSENWIQEDDVLDTWASSWLWCLGTLGWEKPGETTPDLKFWYPTAAIATGPDIIFLWIARMIIAGLELYGENKDTLTDAEIAARIPFRHVYFNGIIRDAQGRKMSKSLGNSPEPLDLIAKFGADGLRFGLLSIAPKGADILFSEDRVEEGRNYCNKLWNAARFRQMSGPAGDCSSDAAIAARIDAKVCDADDHAILGNLVALTDTVNKALAGFDFPGYTAALFEFFRTDYCDWYLEVSKSRLQEPGSRDTVLAIQDLCLRKFLQLLHPLAPFITEELFHLLGCAGEGEFIQNANPGTGADLRAAFGFTLDARAIEATGALREFVTGVRALKAQNNQASKRDTKLKLVAKDAPARAIAEDNLEKIKKLAGIASLEFVGEATGGPAAVTSLGTLVIDLAGSVDAAAEKARLAREIEKLDKVIAGSEAKLGNEAFTSKAPAHILEGARAQLAELKGKREEMLKIVASLG